MITDAETGSCRLDGELIDFVALRTRIALLSDGKTVHRLNNVLGLCYNYYVLWRRETDPVRRAHDLDRVRHYWEQLKLYLSELVNAGLSSSG